MSKKNNTAFTIVELLIVIVVIGILAAITVVSYTGITQRAIVSTIQADLANAKKQLTLYYTDNGFYPASLSGNCPIPADAKYCLRNSTGNSYAYERVTPQTYKLDLTNTNGVVYHVSDSDGPAMGATITLPINLSFNNTSTGSTGTIQSWTVPSDDTYTIEVWGAQGGTGSQGAGGLGARMKGDFVLTSGTIIKILVGQMGTGGSSQSPSGGGGTFVVTSSNTPLIIAGGGGGHGFDWNSTLGNASISTSGNAGFSSRSGGIVGAGGTAGSGGGAGRLTGGGGGFNSNGTHSNSDGGISQSGEGIAYINGGGGGYSASSSACDTFVSSPGGFGGGSGAGYAASGPGGGYSGGGGSDGCSAGSGGGGGSYNAGTNQSNSAGARSGHGLVTITN